MSETHRNDGACYRRKRIVTKLKALQCLPILELNNEYFANYPKDSVSI